MKTKVTGAFVIGFDGKDHVIYKDGEVVYEGNQIVFVGHGYARAGLQPHMHAPAWGRVYQTFDHELTFPE